MLLFLLCTIVVADEPPGDFTAEPTTESTGVDSNEDPVARKRSDYEITYSLVYSRYEDEDGKQHPLRGDLYMPADATDDGEPLPTVLLIHGGGWRSGSKVQMLLHAKKLARHGYAAFAINYRLAPRHKFPAQAHDCKAAVRWLRKNAEEYNFDPNRIAAYGYSAGAQLSCLLGTTDPSHGLEGPATENTDTDENEVTASEAQEVASNTNGSAEPTSTRVQVVIAGGAPCDFRNMPPSANYLTYWLGGTRKEKPKMYELASPAAWVSPDDPPTFFFHGDEDWLVPSHSPECMQRRLNAAGIRTAMHTCAGKGHVNTFADSDSVDAAIEFLDSVLRPTRPTDSPTDSVTKPGLIAQ